MKIRDSVFASLDNVCEGELYPRELAELSDQLQAEDLIDKTDVADCEDASEDELVAQVTAAVKEWRERYDRH